MAVWMNSSICVSVRCACGRLTVCARICARSSASVIIGECPRHAIRPRASSPATTWAPPDSGRASGAEGLLVAAPERLVAARVDGRATLGLGPVARSAFGSLVLVGLRALHLGRERGLAGAVCFHTYSSRG